jgi:hypothetical protein
MTLIQILYPDRTKDFFYKTPFILQVFKRYLTKFSITAHFIVLLLLFAPCVYSQVARLTTGKSPGIPPITDISKQETNPYLITQAHTSTTPRATLDVTLTSDAFPGIAFSGTLNIRRYRSCDSYKTYLAGITAQVQALSTSHALVISHSQIFKSSNLQIPTPDLSPPGTNYKIRI